METVFISGEVKDMNMLNGYGQKITTLVLNKTA